MLYYLKVLAVNAIVLLIVLELCSLVGHFALHGSLFYRSEKPVLSLIAEVEKGELASERVLHPYFGYLNYRPNSTVRGRLINNHGFISDGKDYPWRRTDESQYVIGIFGGSVAEQIYTKGRHRLIETLKRHPDFADREIVVLSFSQPGYKQPQQLQVLSYFLSLGQHIDMVVNLDGFNEIALGAANNRNGVGHAMPSSGHMLQMMDVLNQSKLTPRKVEALAEISRQKRQINDWAKSANTANLASTYLLSYLFYQRSFADYQAMQSDYQSIESVVAENSVFHLNVAKSESDRQQLFETLATYWKESSILMRNIAVANDIDYVHILQPNQYHTKRNFSVEEASIALDEKHIYRAAASEGYPYLLKQFPVLRQNGVRFYSALDILDNEPGIVYADSCCHFTLLGTQIIGGFIADSIIDYRAL